MAVTRAQSDFNSSYDGFLGVGPYMTSNEDLKKLNLLNFALNISIIEKPIVAFYISKNTKV
jgi:hypothetical protein